MKGRSIFISILAIFILGCEQEKPNEIYYPFQDNTWQRFNILAFEIPVERSERPYEIIFFARHNKDFQFRNLDFNMVMNTPSGEERINEYRLKIKNSEGELLGSCDDGLCESSMVLKKTIYINQSGMLLLELENLTPKMKTPGLAGVGVRLQELKQD